MILLTHCVVMCCLVSWIFSSWSLGCPGKSWQRRSVVSQMETLNSFNGALYRLLWRRLVCRLVHWTHIWNHIMAMSEDQILKSTFLLFITSAFTGISGSASRWFIANKMRCHYGKWQSLLGLERSRHAIEVGYTPLVNKCVDYDYTDADAWGQQGVATKLSCNYLPTIPPVDWTCQHLSKLTAGSYAVTGPLHFCHCITTL